MAKFRSKLKRNAKGKTWSKGHSSTSNPTNMKHRLKAKSRFFQPNLSLVPQDDEDTKKNSLTIQSLKKHDAIQSFASKNNNQEPTVNDIATSLKSFTIDQDESMSDSQQGTFKTFKTFASNYSSCTNMSFKKLLNGFRANSDLHKEMLAILTALTEIIKERNGNQTSTEYFLLLIEAIDASKEEKDIIAGLSLLCMGIKTVPKAVLRKKFSETAQLLMNNLERFVESDNKTIVKYIIGCMAVLLRAQDYVTWTYSSTLQYIDTILAFTIHSKPKIRKAAQHAIVSIMCASSFMLEDSNSNSNDRNSTENVNEMRPSQKIKCHPASGRVSKFCLNQFKPEIIATSQTTVLYTLGLLNDTIKVFKNDDIRNICENLLSIMTASNVLLRTKCFQVIHGLFESQTENLNSVLCAKLLSALFEYRPDKLDVRQIIAWLTVLKVGHIHLAKLDSKLCINSLPKLTDICTSELWITDRSELVNNVSVTLKEVFLECVKPICNSDSETIEMCRNSIEKMIKQILKAVNTPFGEFSKYVILTCSVLFECVGEHFSNALQELISSLGNRYDTQHQLGIHIEHAIQSAITFVGAENVLRALPLTDKTGNINLDRSWLLPLLREGTNGATFEYFKTKILKLAVDCNTKWLEYKKQNQIALAHTYELFCCQLWSLFPGFCRNPKDINNFKMIAKTIGITFKNNPEFRAPILDGLNELITNSNDECKNELSKYAKNFLPILFNIYGQKPNGTYEADIRKNMLNVIKMYLTIAPDTLVQELFETALKQFKESPSGTFENDTIMDILYLLLIYQTNDKLKEFLKVIIAPILKSGTAKHVAKDKDKLKKQQRKSYELLYNLLTEEKESCKEFCKKYKSTIQKLLFEALKSTCSACQAIRLKCLKNLIENHKNLTVQNELITKTIPEIIVTFKEFSTKKENVGQELLLLIADLYQKENKLNDFIDIIIAGFAGDQILITNTILALRSIVKHLTGQITVNTLEFILQQIMVFLVQKNRQQVEASIIFLITFVQALPSPLIANHLEFIMRSLSAMVPDTKRYCRIHIGYLLKKLCKKFSANEIIKLVPGDDEVTHKRLKKIRKLIRRENKKLEEGNHASDDDNDDEDDDLVGGLEKKSLNIDDILADSDSDLPDDYDDDDADVKTNNRNDKKRKSSKNKETYIQEELEDIVDLADVKSIGNIITDRPLKNIKKSMESKKSKDPNRGFKTDKDGRLIITDKDVESDDSDDDDDDNDIADDKLDKKPKKRAFEDSSNESDDEEMTEMNKRKRLSSKTSVMSGKTGASSRYTSGGKGIHRTIGIGGQQPSGSSAKSVKSSKSTQSMKSTIKSVKSSAGSEYKSTKAKGDMKKKGKLDPYAYIPLSRNILNKRKRAKNAGQFKNIVKGARTGALKGVKNKIHKKYKK